MLICRTDDDLKRGKSHGLHMRAFYISDTMSEGSPTVDKILYAPTEILFEINEITRFLKSEIEKIGMENSKTL